MTTNAGAADRLPRDAAGFVDVSRLLSPRSVAVIGASDRAGNFGGDTVQRLLTFDFPGPIYPVHPRGEKVRGLESHASVAELPTVPDMAIIALAAASITRAVRECAAVGIKAGIAFAGGFAESGPEGVGLQRELVAACRETGFVLCGPNCAGNINTALPAVLAFGTALHGVTGKLPTGTISIVSQSGGFGINSYGAARRAGFGFRHVISSGNEAIVSFADYVHALVEDDGTELIAGYVEEIRDGPKFVRVLEAARSRGKPVVMLKAGISADSARAAGAHTGALVGNDRVIDAVLRELGVIRVYSPAELVQVLLLLQSTRKRIPAGPGVGFITFGGGPGVLGTDQCAQVGLRIPAVQPQTAAAMKPLLLPVASASNPLDLTPSTAFSEAALGRLPAAMGALSADPGIDALLFSTGGQNARAKPIADVLLKLIDESPKPVAVVWPTPPEEVGRQFIGRGVYCFPDPASCIVALGRLQSHRRPPLQDTSLGEEFRPFPWPTLTAPTVICEDECHRLLAKAGLPVAAGVLATDEAAALAAALALGMPVVLKGISKQVTHRAAAGLLAVDLRTAAEVAEAYRELSGRAARDGVALDGIYVQKLLRGGRELLVSAFRDPVFGVMVSCGAGGGLTELIDDVVIARAPVDADYAATLLGRLRLSRVSGAVTPDANDPAARFIARFSQLAAAAPWKRFVLEVNPVKWHATSAVAVDGLLIVDEC
jgi:acyl-CoA synthetase (NDP forming)